MADLHPDTYRWAFEMHRIGNEAVQKAQEENRRMGVPNVYSFNGFIYYELPNGELSREDPYQEDADERS